MSILHASLISLSLVCAPPSAVKTASAAAKTPAPPVVTEVPLPPPLDDEAEAAEEDPFEFILIPIYSQSPDAGPTALLAASAYFHDGKTKPYKLWLSAIGSASWFGVFSGLAYLEWVRPFETPLRLLLSAGYVSTIAANYCGRGNTVTCDVREAERAAESGTLSGQSVEEFVRRYYRYRYHGPTGTAQLRWAVRNLPHRIEAVLGARSYYYQPGTIGFSGLINEPFRGSKYAQEFPEGEAGPLNILEVGLMIDNRNEEASPSSGYWIEGSLRSASPLTFSAWNFGGVNVTARGYLPLRKAGALVLAQRTVLDGVVGDAPTYELQRVGGSWAFPAFGGQSLGRGIREGRVLGKVKVISQTELRGRLFRWTWFGVPFDLGAVGFVDAAYVAQDWRLLGIDPLVVNWGFGTGLRLKIMQNLLFRFEVAFSPDENFQPQAYLFPGYPF